MDIPVNVSAVFPVFVMVSIAVALCPTVTFPNARFPLNPIVRVAVPVDGAGDGDVLLVPPEHALAKMANRRTQPRLNMNFSDAYAEVVKNRIPKVNRTLGCMCAGGRSSGNARH